MPRYKIPSYAYRTRAYKRPRHKVRKAKLPQYIKAKALIKRWEGCAKILPDGHIAPYKCPAGKWTIGWGHLMEGGGKVKPKIKSITIKQAEELFESDFQKHFNQMLVAVNATARRRGRKRPPVRETHLGAMASFVFNVGMGNFSKSTLLRLYVDGRYDEAGEQFLRWKYAGGRVLKGLVLRRQAERRLFLGK